MRWTPARLLGWLFLAFALVGCGAPQRTVTANPVPSDFTLEVRDLSRGADDAALFIIEPDRWFRAAIGTMPDTNWYPPATRQLTPTQMTAVWEAFQDFSATDQHAGTSTTTVVSIDATRQGSSVHATIDTDVNPTADELIALLRSLAWIDP